MSHHYISESKVSTRIPEKFGESPSVVKKDFILVAECYYDFIWNSNGEWCRIVLEEYQGYANNQIGAIRPASTFSFEEYFFEESLPPTRPYLCILVSSAFFEKEKNSERYKNGCNSRSIDCIRSNLDTRNRIEACRLRLLMEN